MPEDKKSGEPQKGDSPHSVFLSVAFTWVCPSCQERNFLTGVPPTKEHIADLKEHADAYGLEGEEMNSEDWIVSPPKVWCTKCGSQFKVAVEEEEELDETDKGPE